MKPKWESPGPMHSAQQSRADRLEKRVITSTRHAAAVATAIAMVMISLCISHSHPPQKINDTS